MSTVSIYETTEGNLTDTVRKALGKTMAEGRIDLKEARVLIKPNVVKPAKSGSGIVTDSRVVKAVAEFVLEKKPEKVILGEGSAVGYDFPHRRDSFDCMEEAGISQLGNRLGIEVVDLNRDELIDVSPPDAYVMKSFSVAKSAAEADVIIDIPVIKTHVRTGITCALKNMKGVLPGDWKKRTHQLGLDKGIVDLNRAVAPELVLVDGTTAREGAQTEENDKVDLGLILAGSDPVAVDAVCASIAGFDPEEILHVQLAGEAGLGLSSLEEINIRGKRLEQVKRPFRRYHEAAADLYGDATIIEKNACTGCMGELVSTFLYLKEAGLEQKISDLEVVMGSPEKLPRSTGNPLVIGKCARRFRDRGEYIPGCPPHGIEITEKACSLLHEDPGRVRKIIEELHESE